MDKPKIIIIGGPTASGKSSLAIELALLFNGEVIGADSMQIYKGMDIGTGKVTPSEMKGVRHRMIDVAHVSEAYSTSRYVKEAAVHIEEVLKSGKLPIIVGGTGLYLSALTNGFTFGGVAADYQLRDQLNDEAARLGVDHLYSRLCDVDPDAASKIQPSDVKRVVRALEIFQLSGRVKSKAQDSEQCPYDYLFLVVNADRKLLYSAIERRVDSMLEMGLIDEVRALMLPNDSQAIKAIGYKETVQYLSGEITLEQLSYLIKLNSRHYAKRQITYFKNVFPFAKQVTSNPSDSQFLVAEFLKNN